MNQGWAVVLGAVIALVGSALIPWMRESRAETRRVQREAADRRRDAIVEFLAANAALGLAMIGKDHSRAQLASEARVRSTTRVLLESSPPDRVALTKLFGIAMPLDDPDGGPSTSSAGDKIRILQRVVIEWASGGISTDELVTTYSRQIALIKRAGE